MQQRWSVVDAYFAKHFAPPDPVLEAALITNAESGLPAALSDNGRLRNKGEIRAHLGKPRPAKFL